MAKRYVVVEGSQSGHGCCFDATVVDTARPLMVGGINYDNEFAIVCECFRTTDAETIANALNGETK